MTTEEKKLIGEFLGWKVISYKGRDTFDGHQTCRTIGQVKDLLGIFLPYTGIRVTDISIDYENDWNLLMMLSEQCVIREDAYEFDDHYEQLERIDEALLKYHKENLFKAIINYIKWYNEHSMD